MRRARLEERQRRQERIHARRAALRRQRLETRRQREEELARRDAVRRERRRGLRERWGAMRNRAGAGASTAAEAPAERGSPRTRSVLIRGGLVAAAATAGLLVGRGSGDSDGSPPPAREADRTVSTYERALDRELDAVAEQRAATLSRLRAAETPDAQASSLAELAAVHSSAADRLARLDPPPGLEPDAQELGRSLRRVALVYERLARAARRGDQRTYSEAQDAVRRADARMQATLAQFAPRPG